MPAGSQCLKKNGLRRTSYLQVNTAGCTILDGIQIFIDCSLPALIDKAVQRCGVGLIITEITRIDDDMGKGMPHQLGATNMAQIAPLQQLTDTIHAYGTKIFLPEYEARLMKALGHTELAVVMRGAGPLLVYSGEADKAALLEKLRPLMAELPRGQQLRDILK